MLSYLPKDFQWPSHLSHWPVVSAHMIRDDLLEDGSGKQNYALGLVDELKYSEEEHGRFRRLYHQQLPKWEKWASLDHLEGLKSLKLSEGIPSFKDINEYLFHKTGMVVVGVNGLLKNEDFFELLANKIFPVTWWLRKESEFHYIVEPDLFHDLAGHVPALSIPKVADFMRMFGAEGLKWKDDVDHMKKLGALYWFTAEFGLIQENGLKVWGAGILSSSGEIEWSMSPGAEKKPLVSIEEVMNSSFRIDQMQPFYFVLPSWSSLDQWFCSKKGLVF